MEYPDGLSSKQATNIIVDVDAKLCAGKVRTNRQAKTIRRCKECGVKFASKNFNFCPICAVHSHRGKTELYDTDRRCSSIHFADEPANSCPWYVYIICIVGVLFIGYQIWQMI